MLLVIDAFRFDFAYYNTSLDNENKKNYLNEFTIFHELLTERPNNTYLFKAYADPPTVTSQRIKSIVTGSIPSFIDVTKNYNV